MSSLRNSYGKVAQQDSDNIVSDIVVVSSDIMLKTTFEYTHAFVGVVYYNDPDGNTPLDPSTLTGNAVITVRTTNQPHGFQEISNGVLHAHEFNQGSWDANVTEINCTFNSINGATHAQLIVTANRS